MKKRPALGSPFAECSLFGGLLFSSTSAGFSTLPLLRPGRRHNMIVCPTVRARIPGSLERRLRNKRVAIVNDVVNAGSAVRGTFAALAVCEAKPIAIGALLVLGTAAAEFAAGRNLALESIAALPNTLWAPSECPLCASGAMLENVGGFTG
jgi:hypothetical protein